MLSLAPKMEIYTKLQQDALMIAYPDILLSGLGLVLADPDN